MNKKNQFNKLLIIIDGVHLYKNRSTVQGITITITRYYIQGITITITISVPL